MSMQSNLASLEFPFVMVQFEEFPALLVYFGRDSLVSLWTAAVQGGVTNFVFCVVI